MSFLVEMTGDLGWKLVLVVDSGETKWDRGKLKVKVFGCNGFSHEFYKKEKTC